MVNEERRMVETDFAELNALKVWAGYLKTGGFSRIISVIQVLVLITEVSAGMGMLSLMPFPRHSDGEELLRSEGAAMAVVNALFKAVVIVGGLGIVVCIGIRTVKQMMM